MTYSTYVNVCMGIVAAALTGLLLFVAWLFVLDPAWDAWKRARERRAIRRRFREGTVSLRQGLTYVPSPPASWDPPSAALLTEDMPEREPASLREFVEVELERASLLNGHVLPEHHQMLVRALDAFKRERANERAAARRVPRPRGGYSGSMPAKDVPPPPSTPSETIRPRTNEVPNPLTGGNLSAYIDGEIRRGAMWSDASAGADLEIKAGPIRLGNGIALDCTVGGCRWGAVGSERCECKPAAATDGDDFPDPDKDDCPVWLPNDPVVPHKDRTPCRLDSGHDGDHEPTVTATFERAVKIARVVTGAETFDRLTWEAAAARFDRAEARPGAVIG